MIRAALLLLPLVFGACASKRVLKLENRVLSNENAVLRTRLTEVEAKLPDGGDFSSDVDIDLAAEWLDRAGYVYKRNGEGKAAVLELAYAGRNTEFSLTVQHFSKSKVLFLATHDYLQLDDAQDTSGIVLLLVKLAALNYDLLVGKFQLNPESGDILLSAELQLGDGLGYQTFVRLIDHLFETADKTWPDLSKAAGGQGL
ncbi:MAG: YbjN domain-containing protein [Myxococcota bacterium]